MSLPRWGRVGVGAVRVKPFPNPSPVGEGKPGVDKLEFVAEAQAEALQLGRARAPGESLQSAFAQKSTN